MAINWLYFTSIGSVLIILALFLSANGILRADTFRVIFLQLLGGGLLTAGSIGNAVGLSGSEFYPFIVLNGIFSLVAAAALVRYAQKGAGVTTVKTATSREVEY